MDKKVGQKFRVKSHVPGWCGFEHCAYFAPDMFYLVGKVVTINYVSGRGGYILKESSYNFSDCMLEPLSEGDDPRIGLIKK